MVTAERQTLMPIEVAQILGITLNAVYAGIKRGEIPALHIGDRYYIPKAKLDAMLGADCKPSGAQSG